MTAMNSPTSRTELLGPLFWYETARHTRRGHGTMLRCLFALALLGVLYYLYAPRFGVDIRRFSFEPVGSIHPASGERFAMAVFFQSMLWLSVGLLLLTPSYVGTAIAEEKEHGTIELLFTTFVTSREIILGKLCSRLVHLAAFLLAGMPLLAVARVWGGLTAQDILVGYAVLLLSLFSVGALSIFCSVMARSVLAAELSSYGLTILVSLGLLAVAIGTTWTSGRIGGYPQVSSPIAFFLQWENLFERSQAFPGVKNTLDRTHILQWLGMFVLVHGGLGVAFLALATRALRPVCLADANRTHRQPGKTKVRRPPAVTAALLTLEPRDGQERPVEPERTQYVRDYRLYPVTDAPLMWREMYHGSGMAHPRNLRLLRRGLLLGFAACALVMLAYWLAFWMEGAGTSRPRQPQKRREAAILAGGGPTLSDHARLEQNTRLLLRLGTILAMTAWCGAVGLRTANTLSQERGRQTLLGLLTLPIPRHDILWAKWRGGILRYQWLGWVLLAVLGLGLLTGMVHPLALPLLALAFVCHLTFLASFGLWLSLILRAQFTVQMCMGTIVLLMCAAPMLVALYAPDELTDVQRYTLWFRFQDVGASPVNTWWSLLSDPPALTWRYALTLTAVLAGITLYALAGMAFWKGACLLFDRIQGDETAGKR